MKRRLQSTVNDDDVDYEGSKQQVEAKDHAPKKNITTQNFVPTEE